MNEEGRKIFDKNLRNILLNDTPYDLKSFVKAPAVKLVQLFPDSKSVYDFTFEKKKWTKVLPKPGKEDDVRYRLTREHPEDISGSYINQRWRKYMRRIWSKKQ